MKSSILSVLQSILWLTSLWLIIVLTNPLFVQPAEHVMPTLAMEKTTLESFRPQRAEAERFYAEGSYRRAHEIYLHLDTLDLPPAEARWVDFRVADTLWRAQAGTQTPDPTPFEQARQQLEALIRDVQRGEEQDQIWAEVHESLGDFWWTQRTIRDWGQAWPHYQQALDWWASATDIALARMRYLHIVWTMVTPPWRAPHSSYGSYGNVVPLDILENALQIATTVNDKAHASYLIALTLWQQGRDLNQHHRIVEAFEAALTPGKSTDWYDDALYDYAEWLTHSGRVMLLESGEWRQEPDYAKAVALFRRLLQEHTKGETPYYDQAKSQIENITKPVLAVSVPHIFLPESEIQFHLHWRNVKRINFALYPVNLTRDIQLASQEAHSGNWMQSIDLSWRTKVHAWSKDTADKGDYLPRQEMVRLERKLPLGAYILEAKGEGIQVREVVLVTDVALVLKSSGKQTLVYFCNALDGSPLANATVKLWERSQTGRRWRWREATKVTNQDGIAVFTLTDTQNNVDLFVSAWINQRQAFSPGYSASYLQPQASWRIYAFTDRPAYRPQDTVQWKVIARRYNGAVYSTPAHQTIKFEIHDPQGAKVKEGEVTLNTFGSAWGALDLTESMPLGEYQVLFWDADRQHPIGSATLFRLEEYKLPEFQVSIHIPEQEGKKKTFLLGEKVAVSILAEYYFGGPVVNATVEVLIYQNPFYHWWAPPRDFPWFYEDISPPHRDFWGGQGQVIKRETLKTDTTGKATLTFDTPRYAQQDFAYRIEARVTDAARREIIGNGTVRVTRQRYYVYLHPAHQLYQPQDKVTVDVKTLDANDQPIIAEGTVRVTRDYWDEVWLNPQGREVKGEELQSLRAKHPVFPPLGERPWRPKFLGYRQETIFTSTVKTNAEGQAVLTFTPERQGYYRIEWRSVEKGRAPIKAETAVWVTTHATTELGYRSGGLEIIIDKETFVAGQKAPVLLTVPTNDRYVLFSVEGEDLYSYQLLHLSGTAKLVEVSIEEKHVPNIYLSAFMVHDRQLFIDTKPVVIPPVEHFLTVELQSDREQYQPRAEGTFTVTTRDHQGKPVAAELALGVADESIYSIQQEYAGDPRQFFYGTKRGHVIQTQSTFQQKSYAKLIENQEKQLIDERERALQEEDKSGFRDALAESLFATRGQHLAKPSGRAALSAVSADETRREAPMMQAAPAEAGGQEPVVQVRSDFRATLFWQPDIITDAAGRATVKVRFPDSLTRWRAIARVLTMNNQFGIATGSIRTNQPLIVRLQAPRFFVVGDEVTVSAVINNNTEETLPITPSLLAEGIVVMGILHQGRLVQRLPEPVIIPANSESRVDWVVSAQEAGHAKFQVTARSATYADAMEKHYVIHEHGIEKLVATSGKVRGEEIIVQLDLPPERKLASTVLTVQVTPSLAIALLDALPYLIDYPYGCTEQTISRFLPAVVTVKTLQDLGLQPEDILGKIFGGITPAYVSTTQPLGEKNLHKLQEMVQQGLERLYEFQHADGGWGWWKEGESDHFMTAYVVWGLTLAHMAGIPVQSTVLAHGITYLEQEIVEAENSYDLQAWMLHALAMYHASLPQETVRVFPAKALANLWTHRDRLNAYTRALLALSAHYFGHHERAKILVDNLENGVKLDQTPDTSIIQRGTQGSHDAVIGTAHWGEDGIYWRWSDGGTEATAFALRALLAVEPQHKLIEPVTNWLIKNRRGAQWSNTRDTAITILALNDYLRQSKELQSALSYELFVNDHLIVTKQLTPAELLSAPSQFLINPQYLRDGANTIRIVRTAGGGAMYFAAQARFFSQEEPITAAGNELFIRRQYYKIIGRPTLLKGYVYDKYPLHDGETVTSGERVEAVITLEAKNHLEYLVLEDLKPAGLEMVQIRSGEPLYARELKASAVERKLGTRSRTISRGAAGKQRTLVPAGEEKMLDIPRSHWEEENEYTGRIRWVYQELRDREVALFLDKLAEGIWEIRYELRAEVPGQFHALPAMGHAMYVPEIRGNGTEIRINVQDNE